MGLPTSNLTVSGQQARAVRVYVASGSISILCSGATPTAETGELFEEGDRFTVTGFADLVNTRVIRAGDSDATLILQWAR